MLPRQFWAANALGNRLRPIPKVFLPIWHAWCIIAIRLNRMRAAYAGYIQASSVQDGQEGIVCGVLHRNGKPTCPGASHPGSTCSLRWTRMILISVTGARNGPRPKMWVQQGRWRLAKLSKEGQLSPQCVEAPALPALSGRPHIMLARVAEPQVPGVPSDSDAEGASKAKRTRAVSSLVERWPGVLLVADG